MNNLRQLDAAYYPVITELIELALRWEMVMLMALLILMVVGFVGVVLYPMFWEAKEAFLSVKGKKAAQRLKDHREMSSPQERD